MSAQSPVPSTHPLRVAWDRYTGTEEYANTFKWAALEEHRDGSLWAAFEEGFRAARSRPSQAADEYDESAAARGGLPHPSGTWSESAQSALVRAVLCDMRRTWNPCGKKHHATCLASTDIADRVLAALRTVELEAVVSEARLRVLLAAVVNAADKDVGIVVSNEDEHGVTSIDCPSCGAKGKELCRKDCSRNHLLGALDDAALALAAPSSAGVEELRELVARLQSEKASLTMPSNEAHGWQQGCRHAAGLLLAALPALKED